MFYPILKTLLFSLPPEKAHDLTLQVARLSPTLGHLTGTKLDSRLSVQIGANKWGFPVGLAAGLDKNAEALPFFAAQGFGCVECGTVTMKPQLGNPRPRMFRYPEEQSIRNAMGFPNHGLLAILPRLKFHPGTIPLGVNIGKNKDTTADESIDELCLLFESMEYLVDYFVINVSSPNTPGLRELQEKSYLSELFKALNECRRDTHRDVYLKIAPDLPIEKVRELAKLASDFKLTGLIATNTTIIPELGIGGVSGVLLRDKSRLVRQSILQEGLPLELIGVGGISEPKDLFEFWYHGGKVAQIYTAYVYQGPHILKTFKKALLDFLSSEGLSDLENFFKLSLPERQRILKPYL
ncbi:MAG TPA: quinone-dependent dihydroorotate dehydrogenase [Bacteriovoracaceae bacterium]|nr:quinone-dependent dihydroorotate dehydrogenase [Bacteriovoracaceae bacterium]